MSYDYIIVGGGPAGCVLANRLSADAGTRVLLLEAGNPDTNPLITMPAGFAKLTGPRTTWGYKTVPQKHLGNREMLYAQGRILGGGSSINAQVFTRGNPLDYDEWEQEEGCTGWNFENVLPYFRRSEDNIRLASRYHGQGGPLKVSDPVPHKLTSAFVRAAQQAGFDYSSDFNGEKQAGFGYYQTTNRDGRRSSGSSCYLNPIRQRPNLTVLTQTAVTRILFESSKAVGVEYARGNSRRLEKVYADREILVTSGAIGSPKLLLLSGIGPANSLRQHDIEPVLDLPAVGQNLQDHMDIFIVSECTGNYSFDRYKPWYMSAWAGLEYLLFNSGLVASNLCDGGGFWWGDKSARSPDLQFHFLPGSGLEAGLEKIGNGVTLNSAFLRPRSRGSVTLSSSDPSQPPLIDPNYWADEYDQKISIEGFKIARDILSQPVFAPYIKREFLPGKQVTTDQQIKEYAMQFSKTDYHPVGTCKMGPEGPDTVVGIDLKVHGIEGLRVADSSIMPRLVSSNTNAPTIMIGEKVADIISGSAAKVG